MIRSDFITEMHLPYGAIKHAAKTRDNELIPCKINDSQMATEKMCLASDCLFALIYFADIDVLVVVFLFCCIYDGAFR